MSEQTWLSCTAPGRMLHFLGKRGSLSDRKLRLFGCACARQLDLLRQPPRPRRGPAPLLLRAIETAESFADGQATAEELAQRSPYAVANQSAADAARNSARDEHLRDRLPLLAGL